VLANDVDYFRRIEAEWGVPVTVDTENLSLLVERVRSLIEDDTRLEQLSEIMAQYKRANSFEKIGADHQRINYHVDNGTVAALGDRASSLHDPSHASRPVVASGHHAAGERLTRLSTDSISVTTD